MSKVKEVLDDIENPVARLIVALSICAVEIAKLVIILHFVIKYW